MFQLWREFRFFELFRIKRVLERTIHSPFTIHHSQFTIDSLKRTIFREEIFGFFRAESCNSRNIVRTIPHDREIVAYLSDRYSEFLEDICLLHELLLHRIIDMDMSITNKLTEILV